MPKCRTLTMPRVSKFVQQQELSFVPRGNANLQVLGKTFWWFVTKLNILLPHIYSNDLKSYVHTKTYTQMLVEILFRTVKLGSNYGVVPYVNG